MIKSSEHPTGPQDLRDGESIADAAIRLGRDPVELFADLLDTELKPALDSARKANAARIRRQRERRRKAEDREIELWEARGYSVTGRAPDGTLSFAKTVGEAEPEAAEVLPLDAWRARHAG